MPRIVFTFDEPSYQALQQLTKEAETSSMAATVRESLRLAHVLRKQAKEGFDKLIVRNGQNEERMILVTDFLTRGLRD